jgi:hypothetical protein
MPVLWSRARPVTVTVMTYFCLCIDTACKYSISVPVYPYDQRLNQPDSEAAACGQLQVECACDGLAGPGPAVAADVLRAL